jgi:hypothetical protein
VVIRGKENNLVLGIALPWSHQGSVEHLVSSMDQMSCLGVHLRVGVGEDVGKKEPSYIVGGNVN